MSGAIGIEDIEVGLADQVEQQIQRPLEGIGRMISSAPGGM